MARSSRLCLASPRLADLFDDLAMFLQQHHRWKVVSRWRFPSSRRRRLTHVPLELVQTFAGSRNGVGSKVADQKEDDEDAEHGAHDLPEKVDVCRSRTMDVVSGVRVGDRRRSKTGLPPVGFLPPGVAPSGNTPMLCREEKNDRRSWSGQG